MTFAEVEKFVTKRGGIYTKSEEECDILEAFKVLDKEGTGKISVRDFRRCMTTLGDKMADEDVEEILLLQRQRMANTLNMQVSPMKLIAYNKCLILIMQSYFQDTTG